jgi:quercetin dioxygenase-like cupin family protein
MLTARPGLRPSGALRIFNREIQMIYHGETMSGVFEFLKAIQDLRKADIPFEGCTAYIIQGNKEQVLFMKFEKDVELPEHSHEAQWGIVLSGNIELTINGTTKIYKTGDNYYIEKGVKHKGKIYAGYSDITYFNQKDRYKVK